MDSQPGASRGLGSCLWPSPRLSSSISRAGTPIRASRRLATREPPNATPPDLALDSVAVLPFTNAGADASSDYLSDGITESLIGNLAHIPQLKVRSRDSVFRLKGKDIEVQDAGSELGVSVVVSGRVAVQANNIEVSAELTNVRDNTEIWGKAVRLQESPTLSICKSKSPATSQSSCAPLSLPPKSSWSAGKARRAWKPTICT